MLMKLSERMRQDMDADARPAYYADEVAQLEDKLEVMEDALVHCGYDVTDCIDCGGPPHNEWCRFWKLRDIVPLLFA